MPILIDGEGAAADHLSQTTSDVHDFDDLEMAISRDRKF